MNKHYTFFFAYTIMTLLSSNAMQITEPYKPSFYTQFARHPKASALICASGAVLCTTGIELSLGFSPSLITNLYVGVRIACCTYEAFDNYYKKHAFIDTLLTNPLQALQDIRTTQNNFLSATDKIGLDQCRECTDNNDITFYARRLRYLVATHTKECPVFLLNECSGYGWNACRFSREINYRLRAAFEARASLMILEKLKSLEQNRSLNYAAFGCGDAFSDLVIAAKVLAEKPDAFITLHVIDSNNKDYTDVLDFYNTSHEIFSDTSYNFDNRMIEHIQSIRKNLFQEHKNRSNQSLFTELLHFCLSSEAKHQQFVSFLQHTFPNATISLYVHSTTQRYLKYLEKHRLYHADVICAADVDEVSLDQESMRDYFLLCAKTLQNNPSSRNLLLGFNDKVGAGLYAITSNKPETKHTIHKIGHGEDTMQLYLSSGEL